MSSRKHNALMLELNDNPSVFGAIKNHYNFHLILLSNCWRVRRPGKNRMLNLILRKSILKILVISNS